MYTTLHTKQRTGAYGEQLAADYLATQGHTVVSRNWHCRYGELDLVTRDGPDLIAVEVKTRRGAGYGSPLESITPVKVARLRRLLLLWLRAHPEEHATCLRIDAVGITLYPHQEPHIEHLRGIQ